ncbi:MAG: CPCC family cysteine-rich protein [Caldilineaceae bacterium]
MSVTCPCCGYLTLTAAQNYETCPVCGWVDIPPADMMARRTLNSVTLLQAQRNFLLFGACAEEVRAFVRAPTAAEPRAADWQPWEVHSRQQQHALLDRFMQSRLKLFDLLAVQIDDACVHDLIDPTNDAGINPFAQQQHALKYAALNQIIVGKFPAYVEIYEILEYVSWRKPDLGVSSPERYRQACIECAFACAALLLAANQPHVSAMIELRPTMISNLVECVLHLDKTMVAPALQLLCQSVFALDLDRHLPELSMAILVLATALPGVEHAHLERLRVWALQEEQRLGKGIILL